MAKKKGEKNNSKKNNQMVYYILFFVLGAIFAAGILAVNDGISGRVIEGSYDSGAIQMLAGYSQELTFIEHETNLDEQLVRSNNLVSSHVEQLLTQEGGQIFLAVYTTIAAGNVETLLTLNNYQEELSMNLGIPVTLQYDSTTGKWNPKNEIHTIQEYIPGEIALMGGDETLQAQGATIHYTTKLGTPVAVVAMASTGNDIDDIYGATGNDDTNQDWGAVSNDDTNQDWS